MPSRSRHLGTALIALGALFLIARLGDLSIEGWPLFILVPGLLGLAAAWLSDDFLGLAVPGAVVATVGAILLGQSMSGRFESWAYAWALVPAAVGAGQWLQGDRSDDATLQRRGGRELRRGLTMFVLFALLFEGFIFGDLRIGRVGSYLVPLLLIGGGIYLFFGRSGHERGGDA